MNKLTLSLQALSLWGKTNDPSHFGNASNLTYKFLYVKLNKKLKQNVLNKIMNFDAFSKQIYSFICKGKSKPKC